MHQRGFKPPLLTINLPKIMIALYLFVKEYRHLFAIVYLNVYTLLWHYNIIS